MSGSFKDKSFQPLVFLVLCLPFLLSCKQSPAPTPPPGAQSNPAAPAWYARQAIDAPGHWVGFGDALTLEQAKAQASADLATTFKSEIRGSLRIDQSFDGDSLEQRAQSRIEQFTSAEFDDLSTLRSEQHAGRYYLVLGYDHRSLHQRLAARLNSEPGQSPARQQLPIASRLYQQLQSSLGQVPALQLNHERGRYLLSAGAQTWVVRDDEVESLYPQANSSELQLTLTPAQVVYAPETLFKTTIATQQSGYLSYLQVFGNGALALMFANQPVSTGERFDYPDPSLYDGLVTELPPDRAATSVQHMVMLCPDPRDLTRLESLSTRANEQYQGFLLGDWNRWFMGCDGRSLTQRIRH